MRAQDMELFLAKACNLCEGRGDLLQLIADAGPQLRVWGLLDSVLRMMPRPQEILAQPGRFLSYFVSPEPPVENIQRTENSIEMDIPVSADMYPLCAEYLRAAFATLPVYVGRSKGHCSWQGLRLKIEWEKNQRTLFTEDPGHQLSPEILRSIVSSLETHQAELQRKNSELQEHNERLLRAQREMETQLRSMQREAPSLQSNDFSSANSLSTHQVEVLRHQFARLSDYMVRAQQLIAIILGSNRSSPAVREAMKRMDWEWVQNQFPETMRLCQQVLRGSISSAESIEESKNTAGKPDQGVVNHV
jgi:hypothetical protein